jgi:hypothetical protein
MLHAIPLWLKIWPRTSVTDKLADPNDKATKATATNATAQTVMNSTFLPIYFE